MTRYLFKVETGEAVPAMATKRKPNGRTLLTIPQTIKRFGETETVWRSRWDARWGDFMPPEDVIEAPLEGYDEPKTKPNPAVVEKLIEYPPTPLTFATGTTTRYRTYITAERLIDGAGKPAMGFCLPSQKLILISSHFPKESWAETWLHEARHAWHNSSPRPKEDEPAIEWETTVSRESHGQFIAQGAAATLTAMKPIAGIAPADIVQVDEKAVPRNMVLRRKFSHLNELQFQMAKETWEARNLNPWADEFFVRTDRGRVRIVMTLPGLRKRAIDSGAYRGGHVEQFVYDTADQRRPSSCIYVVYRMIDGERVAFYAEVKWSDAYGDDPMKVDALVISKPHDCLEALAESKCLRKAFPHECNDIYTDQEMKRPVTDRNAARTAPPANGLPTVTKFSPNDRPGSADGMRARLFELGFKTHNQQQALIRNVEAVAPCQDGDEPEFYARVVAAAKQAGCLII